MANKGPHLVLQASLVCLLFLVIWQSVYVDATMAFYIYDHHIVFNHIDVYHLCILGSSYFEGSDYLVVKVWIRVTVPFLSFKSPAGTIIYMYVKIFSWVFGYWGSGIPCHCIVAMGNVAYPFVLITYTSLTPYSCSFTTVHISDI